MFFSKIWGLQRDLIEPLPPALTVDVCPISIHSWIVEYTKDVSTKQTMEFMETTSVTSKASNFQQTWPNFHKAKTPEDGLVAHCQHTFKHMKTPNFIQFSNDGHPNSLHLSTLPKPQKPSQNGPRYRPPKPSVINTLRITCTWPWGTLQSHPLESSLWFLRLNPFLLPLERPLPNSWKRFAEAPGHTVT